jgi:hypothetical protein
MAKRKPVDLKAAKAAKQKKIVIVGGILFVALLVYQVPRTLKMLHPKSQTAAHTAARTAPATTATTPGSTGLPASLVSNTPAGATVLTAQLDPAAREGQLADLSASFKSKDPFKQLINEDAGTTATTSPTATATPAKPDVSLKVVPSTKTEPAATGTPVAPGQTVALPLLSAVISVNGVKEGVNVKVDFPADAPLFHLVSLTKKTAKISVSGGSLANGSQTLTLRRNKPLTLVNTADGTRYRLVLVTTSHATAAAVATPTQGTGATGTATTPTTTTQTTTTPTIGG